MNSEEYERAAWGEPDTRNVTKGPAEDWQQRVVDEFTQLDMRLAKLEDFIEDGGSTFITLPAEDKRLLRQQRTGMRLYCRALKKRIARFSL